MLKWIGVVLMTLVLIAALLIVGAGLGAVFARTLAV